MTGPCVGVAEHINIGFYDPLADGAELLLPPGAGAARLPVRHNRAFVVGRGREEPFGANYDLELYDNRSMVGLLEASRPQGASRTT